MFGYILYEKLLNCAFLRILSQGETAPWWSDSGKACNYKLNAFHRHLVVEFGCDWLWGWFDGCFFLKKQLETCVVRKEWELTIIDSCFFRQLNYIKGTSEERFFQTKFARFSCNKPGDTGNFLRLKEHRERGHSFDQNKQHRASNHFRPPNSARQRLIWSNFLKNLCGCGECRSGLAHPALVRFFMQTWVGTNWTKKVK